MTRSLPILLLLGACASDPSDSADGGPPGDPDATSPGELGAIERCAEASEPLTAAWSVDNQHGEVRSMTTDPDGRVVLGSLDRTVKVWNFGFGGASPLESPGYGTPYEPGDGIATALAFSDDRAWLAGADDAGDVSVWYASEGDLRARLTASEVAMTAIAFLDSDHALTADESYAGNLRVWDVEAGTLGDVLTTELWGVTDIAVSGDHVYVAGDDYGLPSVEHRLRDDLGTVTTRWVDFGFTSLRVRVAAAGERVFATGAGFVAIFDATLETSLVVPVADLDGIAIAATPGGAHFAVLDTAGNVRLYDATGAERSRTTVPASVGLSVDATGEVIMVGGADGWLRSFTCP